MKYYKLKTVAFSILATAVMSFDLKGNEDENEVICLCCCSDEGKKNEENKKLMNNAMYSTEMMCNIF